MDRMNAVEARSAFSVSEKLLRIGIDNRRSASLAVVLVVARMKPKSRLIVRDVTIPIKIANSGMGGSDSTMKAYA